MGGGVGGVFCVGGVRRWGGWVVVGLLGDERGGAKGVAPVGAGRGRERARAEVELEH